MGRTLPAATQLILNQVSDIQPLYEALPRSRQVVLDHIFDQVIQHKAAFSNAANLLPLEILLVLVQLEERTRANRDFDALYAEIEKLKEQIRGPASSP